MTLTSRKFLLILLLATAVIPSSASAKPGNGKGGGDSDPPEQTSCAAYNSEFPAFTYNQISYSRKGSVQGHDIYLSNADGSCSVLLVSIPGLSSEVLDLNYKQLGSTGLVAWRQGIDETVRTRDSAHRNDLIRLVRFEIANNELISTDIHTVKNSGTGEIEFNSIDLSSDGNSILVYQANPNSAGVYVSSIHEMDITVCTSDCSMNKIYQDDANKILLDVSYNGSNNRVYFSGYYRFLDHLGDLSGQGFISFIENIEGQWIGPRLVTIENNGYYNTPGESYYAFPTLDVASVDFGNGMTEAVVHTFADTNIDPPSAQVIDMGTCSVDGTEDCIHSKESTILFPIDNAEYANFGEGSVYFSSATSQEIYRYGLISQSLAAVALGNESDSPR